VWEQASPFLPQQEAIYMKRGLNYGRESEEIGKQKGERGEEEIMIDVSVCEVRTFFVQSFIPALRSSIKRDSPLYRAAGDSKWAASPLSGTSHVLLLLFWEFPLLPLLALELLPLHQRWSHTRHWYPQPHSNYILVNKKGVDTMSGP
jgi:hypothetical protein